MSIIQEDGTEREGVEEPDLSLEDDAALDEIWNRLSEDVKVGRVVIENGIIVKDERRKQD